MQHKVPYIFKIFYLFIINYCLLVICKRKIYSFFEKEFHLKKYPSE